MLLPDVNVWLALAFHSHSHHSFANAWYEALTSERSFFCRWTQQGFLRLATNPSVFKKDALTLIQAWEMYDKIMSDPRITYVDEPDEVESYWRSYTRRRSFSPKVWSDAYLAAFACAADLELISFDKGFAQYKGLRYKILS